MTAAGFRCSSAARERGDSMLATAPPARRWLLLDREGAWPTHALSVFPKSQAHALSEKAARAGARISLIRRPRRHPASHGPFTWAVADVQRGQEGIRWHTAYTIEEVLDTPWEVTSGEGDPVALVCSHSRHDVCCALRGRPVAAALEPVWPGRVWECSHLGGDRFAATMVVLPTGLCYGRLDESNAAAVLAAFDRGQVVPDLLRGRCADPREAQAAAAIGWQQGLAAPCVDALVPAGPATHAGGITTVAFSAPDLRISYRETEVELGTPSTCRAHGIGHGREYTFVGVQRR